MKYDKQANEIREKIIKGLKKSSEKLIESAARNKDFLVISENGAIYKFYPHNNNKIKIRSVKG